MTFTDAEEARLARCQPDAQAAFRTIADRMEARRMPVFIGETGRTDIQQAVAVASGKSSEHQTKSWHTLKPPVGPRACDFRKRLPGDAFDPTTDDEEFFQALYEEATAADCRSLAFHPDGTKIILQTTRGPLWDAGHVEYRHPYATLEEAWEAAESQT